MFVLAHAVISLLAALLALLLLRLPPYSFVSDRLLLCSIPECLLLLKVALLLLLLLLFIILVTMLLPTLLSRLIIRLRPRATLALRGSVGGWLLLWWSIGKSPVHEGRTWLNPKDMKHPGFFGQHAFIPDMLGSVLI